MIEKIEKKVDDALGEDDITSAVDWLKKGIRRDPEWERGHRLLGDIYFEVLGHYRYALVEYRKLNHVSGDSNSLDSLRLARAYEKQEFYEKALELLNEVTLEDCPDTIAFLDNSYDPRELHDELHDVVRKEVDHDREQLYEQHREDGHIYREDGQYRKAQEEYERALELKANTEVRVDLARCLIRRAKFPEAMNHLKKVLNTDPNHDDARDLLMEVYQRLGLPRGAVQERSEDGPGTGDRKSAG
ncbi:MAG: tetratricopeptide repeat protein [bacterium]